MQNKIVIFCTSHKIVSYLNKFYPILQMVGLGNDTKFPSNWHLSNSKENISDKFFSYADLVGHYYVWKNLLNEYNQDYWVGFSQYRRLWIKNKINTGIELSFLEKLILKKADNSWNNYDVIIPSPFFFKKKKIKILKNILLFPFKRDINLLNLKTSVFDQFAESLGPFGKDLILQIIQHLPTSERYDFLHFLKTRKFLSAHGMYISKKAIINHYSSVIFKWFLKCEQIINKNNNLPLIKNARVFQYINERFLDYWFNKYYRVLRWPIIMYNENKNKLTLVGKI